MLERLASIGIMVAACASSACSPKQALLRKVDLLEKQVGDLHRSQGRMNGRIDELQIQLSLLAKKLAARPAAKSAPATHAPSAMRNGTRPAPRPRLQETIVDSGVFRGRMREIDPHQVQERLPSRPRPARRGPGMRLSVEEPDGIDERTVREAFRRATSLHNRAEHHQAVEALQAFAQAYPEHPYAIEALFLAGRSRMALGETERAEDDFVVLAQRHPASERAPGALLLAGRCQEQLGRPRTARSTYLQLIQSYPLTGEAAEANRRLKALRVMR